MLIVQYCAIVAAFICFCVLLSYLIRIIRAGKPKDLSNKSGDTKKGILYANTEAMLPQNKESAYLHIPSYASGMLFHIGTFGSLLLFILSFIPSFNCWLTYERIHLILPAILIITCACGYLLFFKRMFSKDLRDLSNPDDFISNAFISTFQLSTLLYLIMPTNNGIVIFYYVWCTLLFLYFPLGKLRHAVYYFAARYHLGFFYGWRNVWPLRENTNDHTINEE